MPCLLRYIRQLFDTDVCRAKLGASALSRGIHDTLLMVPAAGSTQYDSM
jgi:hypothetical protein